MTSASSWGHSYLPPAFPRLAQCGSAPVVAPVLHRGGCSGPFVQQLEACGKRLLPGGQRLRPHRAGMCRAQPLSLWRLLFWPTSPACWFFFGLGAEPGTRDDPISGQHFNCDCCVNKESSLSLSLLVTAAALWPLVSQGQCLGWTTTARSGARSQAAVATRLKFGVYFYAGGASLRLDG